MFNTPFTWDGTSNIIIETCFANTGYTQANNAASFANGAFDRANSGYNQANSAASFANGAFVQANSAYNQANAAYGQANTGISVGQAADTDTLVASAKAYINALNKLIIKRKRTAPSSDLSASA